MKKTFYEAPDVEVFDVITERGILTNSVESMNTVAGSWDEED